MSSSTAPSEQSGFCRMSESGVALIAVSWILFLVATIVLPVRLWVRVKMTKCGPGYDDACLVAAYLFAVPTHALFARMSAIGVGRHRGCYSDQELIQALKLEYIAEFIMILSKVFSRASVAFFVARVFGVARRITLALYCYTGFMCVSMVVTACLIWARCTPVEALWNYHLLPQARCWSGPGWNFVNYYNGAVAILSDFLLAVLPLYFLHNLQMPRSLKATVTLLMAIGVVPMICAICRTAYASTQATGDDPLYESAILLVFGTTEMLVLIICTSVTAYMPLFRLAKPKLFPNAARCALTAHPKDPDSRELEEAQSLRRITIHPDRSSHEAQQIY